MDKAQFDAGWGFLSATKDKRETWQGWLDKCEDATLLDLTKTWGMSKTCGKGIALQAELTKRGLAWPEVEE